MVEPQRVRWQVMGRVQGVSFRYFTQQNGRQLGLRGWARNLADGSVEVVAEGATAALDELEARLRQGPRLSRVDDVVRRPAPDDLLPETFEVRF